MKRRDPWGRGGRVIRTPRRPSLERYARLWNGVARERMRDGDIAWFAVFVPCGKEFAVQRMLSRKGLFVYLPLCRKWRRLNRYSRTKVRLAYPAIAGCVFLGVRGHHTAPLEVFRWMGSLRGVIGLCGAPLAISGERLEAFVHDNRFRFEADDSERFMRSNYEFKVGDQVRIVEGPFEGHVVDVRGIRGDQARIWVPLFGTLTETSIALDKMECAA